MKSHQFNQILQEKEYKEYYIIPKNEEYTGKAKMAIWLPKPRVFSTTDNFFYSLSDVTCYMSVEDYETERYMTATVVIIIFITTIVLTILLIANILSSMSI